MGKKMGRPTKLPSERREKVITLRLTADEVKALNTAAAQAGENRSEWARKVLTLAASAIR